ncbi:hypothetical protein N7537_011734 [Penicillium hordei]|uniref:Aminoglycoside phosphotransferase domain-containing protein n=1 Tax=Penicillium hordei TaxID=40994 RepID=A0AAD6DMQ3_9EURO|nr:uncharacterized protein N7537_011734 [Penicillium hordei]KAJ5589056.1 hypothetical protein N7537_011734 [Penicillium hordei]
MRMEYGDAAWERSDNIFNDFKKKVISHDVLLAVTEIGSDRLIVRVADLGAFNLCFSMVFEDGFSSFLRFPCPGRLIFPGEKVRNEVALMPFLKQNPHIPFPNIIHHGMRDEGPAGLGLFILMEYVAHASNLATQIRAPGYKRGDRPFLDPNIEDEKLELFYGQMADILLGFSKLSLDKIGSLARDAKIVAVIDWGFTYTAPAKFAFISPWWLLWEMPENGGRLRLDKNLLAMPRDISPGAQTPYWRQQIDTPLCIFLLWS